METAKIERINELYRKSKAEGLTEEEKKEQQILRREYVDAFKRDLRGQLNNISIKEKDGSITNLGEKYGQKKGNQGKNSENETGTSKRRGSGEEPADHETH